MAPLSEKKAPRTGIKGFLFNPRKMIFACTFGLIFCIAASVLGLVSQQLHNGGNLVTNYPTAEIKHDLGLLLFICIFQFLICLFHWHLPPLFVAFLTFVSAVFWGAGAGILFQVSPFKSYTCGNPVSSFTPAWQPFVSQCSRYVAMEGLAWANWGLDVILLFGLLADNFQVKLATKPFYPVDAVQV